MGIGLGAAALGSAAIGAGASAFGGFSANAASKQSAEDAMDFQKHMYKHRYQYQMQDMRKAGLNPILAYRQAPPGSPSGSSYLAQNPFMHAGETAVRGVSSAVDARRQTQQQKQSNEQIRQIDAAVTNTEADTAVKASQAKNIQTDTALKVAQTAAAAAAASQSTAQVPVLKETEALTKLKSLVEQETLKASKRTGKAAEIEEDILDSAVGKFLKWIDFAGRALNPFASTAKDASQLSPKRK